MSDLLLDMRNVSAVIGDQRPLLDVSLSLRRGTTLGVVGESGSGKSLSLRVVMGMLGRVGGHVTDGSVAFDGKDLLSVESAQWPALRGSQIGFVPQNSSALLNPVRRIGSQIRETVRRLDPEADSLERSRELLEAVHIARPDDVLRKYPHEVSGGMLQRIMIALAIAGRPTMLIADEPTTALDVTVQKSVLLLFDELKRELAMSMIFVSHDIDVVEAVSDDIAVMYAGTTVETGLIDRVLADPQHPYTSALLRAHPTVGSDSSGIPGSAPAADARPPGCQFAPRCPLAGPECEKAPVVLSGNGRDRAVACVKLSVGGAA